MLPQVQNFFELEIKEFWKKSVHFSFRNDGAAIGDLFGKYLYPYSVLESERVSCMFEIEEKHMEFCLPTLCHIFGLGQHAHAAARIILTDKKAIGLCLLKKACLLDLKQPVHKTLYRTYRSWFKHQVVPVSFNNNSSVKLVENILGGLIVHLNEQSMDAVDFMHDKYHPYFEDLTNVSNGGDNIWYGPPAKSLPEWNSFDKNPKLHPFINQVGEAIKDFWGNKTNFMQYETVFLFSELNETRDNIPQKAHVDLSEDLIEFEESKIGAKSLIGFTPINPDGMMYGQMEGPKNIGLEKKSSKTMLGGPKTFLSLQVSIFCIFLMEFLLLYLEIPSMQVDSALEGSGSVQPKTTGRQTMFIISRISIFILLSVALLLLWKKHQVKQTLP